MTVPHQNLEAEQSVLGAMLISSDAVEAVSEILTPEDFYRESHGAIFRACLALHAKNEPVDVITAVDFLQERGELEKAGGLPRISELAAIVPAAGNAAHYARIVKDVAGLRRLVRAGAEIQRLGQERPGELDDLMIQAEAALSAAVSSTVTTQFGSITDGLDDLLEEIREAVRTGEVKMGLRTGFTDLDTKLTGLHPGQLIYVAARPGMGKSALALNIAENVADMASTAAVLTLEMSKTETQIRSLSRASRIDSYRLRTGKIPKESFDIFRSGIERVKAREQYLFIEDNPATSVQQLRAEARRLQRTKGLDLIVVDYIQLLISSSKTEENRQQEVSAISRSLKLMARELNVPVLALSQLNRNLEIRTDKRPGLSDLRDSGSLEQDADVVLFIYRDDYYNPDSPDAGMAEVIVAKNRQGERGTVKLGWRDKFTEFTNLGTGLRPLEEAS